MNQRPTNNTAARIAFLRDHEPFDAMSEGDVRWMAGRLETLAFARGDVLLSPGDGPVGHLFIVSAGTVGSRPDTIEGEVDRVLVAGELFPVGALSAGGATTRAFVGIEDGVCLKLARADFIELRRVSSEFEHYCADVVTETLKQSLESLYAQYSQRAAEERTLATPIGELVRKAPVSCRADAPLAVAVKRMDEANVRTVVAVDAAGAPVGMFTLVDLLRRVVLPGRSLDRPLSEAMSAPIHILAPGALAHEAMQLMTERGIRQVIVADEKGFRGVVSERDLAALQRVSVQQVSARLHAAASVAELAAAAADVRRLAHTLLVQGISAEPLTRTISALNDALTRRAIDLLSATHDLGEVAWCWLSLGSEGRGEQTLSTDQDNALVFRGPDGEADDATRERLLVFARDVNAALAELGFELCPGNVMASNPELCLSMDEWKAKFLEWLRQPTPPALLQANIVFDFRALFGDAALAIELREWLSGFTTTSTVFLRLLVQNALEVEPPLGLIRTFAVEDKGDDKGTLDLKTRGTRLFVDCARVFALALGMHETNTATRLRKAAPVLGIEAREIDGAIEAFQFLQMLRMRNQGAPQGGNRVNPHSLNDVEQRMLKESFRQAKNLQERVRLAYRL